MPRKKKTSFDIEKISSNAVTKNTEIMSEVQQEIISEEYSAFKDYIKGACRFMVEKEREAQKLLAEAAEIKHALTEADKGNWKPLREIKIPARFLPIDTLRMHGRNLLAGAENIRFVDLYEPGSKS